MPSVADIAEVHGVEPRAIRQNFNNIKQHFREGIDYFKVSYAECQKSKISTSSLFKPNPGSGLVLFTTSGYLMLVKSLTDDRAWQVQRTLVDSYFQLEEIKGVLKETGGVYVSEEAMFDDDDLLIAKALEAASLKIERYEARLSEMQPKVERCKRSWYGFAFRM